jgi:hypothetical protein
MTTLTVQQARSWEMDRLRRLDVASPAAWPRRAHSGQSGLLKVVVNLARVAVEVLGNHIADLAEAGGGRNADIFAQVVKAFEYPETHACIKRLRLAASLQCLMAAGGRGPSLIINRILCERGGRRRGRDKNE